MRGLPVIVWHIVDNIINSILELLCRIFHKELSEEIRAAFTQFVKFGIIGVSNTFLSYFVYIIMLVIFRQTDLFENCDYLAAQMIGFVLSVLWSFYWNNKIVFIEDAKSKRTLWKTLMKTFAAYSFTGLFLNSILLILWVQILNISEYTAPIFNLLFIAILNFLINKFWAFK